MMKTRATESSSVVIADFDAVPLSAEQWRRLRRLMEQLPPTRDAQGDDASVSVITEIEVESEE